MSLLKIDYNKGNYDARTQPLKIILPQKDILDHIFSSLSPVDFYNLSQPQPGQKLVKKHYLINVIEELLHVAKSNGFSLCMNEGIVYIYNGAFWHELNKTLLMNFLGVSAEKMGVDKFDARYHSFRTDMLKQFMSTAYLPKPANQGDGILINLQNGTFDISPMSQYLRGFDKKDFLIYQLPFRYDSRATCPTFDTFLKTVLPDPNQQKILAEFCGYLFINQQTLKLEKALILYGSGANGKSVFFEVLTALLGNVNVSNYNMESLTKSGSTTRAQIASKLVNYGSELSARMDVSTFKLLISGEPVEVKNLYQDPYIMHNYAKFIFNTNELPKDVEQTDAFFRRFLILHFAVIIPEHQRDVDLSKRIIKVELAGVLNWILAGLNRLLVQKKFTDSAIVTKTLKDYRLSSDTVQLFIEEEHYRQDNSNEIPLKVMYSDYKQYCSIYGHRVTSIGSFSERLRSTGYKSHRKNIGYVVYANKTSIIQPSLPTRFAPAA